MKRLITLLLMIHLVANSFAQVDAQRKMQGQFIDAENGSTIQLPEGKFQLSTSLWLDGKKNIIIQGAGTDKTILDFEGQLSGAEGIKITNSSAITVKDLTVQNTKGDGIKAQLVDGINFTNVKTEWTKGPDETNGGYGIYPVQCNNVLIDHCVAVGASDAGIYVGQSKYIIVKNSIAHHNVAGIEIENSLYADVFDNEAYENTGGILVFDLPDLIQKQGGFIRVFNNKIHNNNHDNFAPKGNIVGKVPPGTGLMILATRDVEIFENEIRDNITAGTAIISYYMTENPIHDSTYNPFPSRIYIHDNHYERPRVRATSKGRMGKLFRIKLRFGKDVPHIIYDGIEDQKMKKRKICIQNNTNVSVANIDAANKFKNISRNEEPFRCEQHRLPEVELTAF